MVTRGLFDDVKREKEILVSIRGKHGSRFIVNLHHVFTCSKNVYLMFDYVEGGDLRYHLGEKRRFSEIEISENRHYSEFIVACILIGLKRVHQKGIVHRDIKPENVMLDREGYAKLIDFGISAFEEKLKDGGKDSGTPGYMAPEVVCKMPHSYGSDFFAIGILCYELLLHSRPYVSDNKKDLQKEILANKVKLTKKELPHNVKASSAFLHIINKLLVRNPNARIGSIGGVKEIMKHEWFDGFAWSDLKEGKMAAPFVPGKVKRKVLHSSKPTINGDDEEERLIYDRIRENESLVSSILFNYKITIEEDNSRNNISMNNNDSILIPRDRSASRFKLENLKGLRSKLRGNTRSNSPRILIQNSSKLPSIQFFRNQSIRY